MARIRLTRARRRRVAVVFALASTTVLVAGGPAGAVHDDNLFELGPTPAPPTNILGDGVAANGPDWADIFNASGGVIPGALDAFGGVAASFEADANSARGGTDPTTFGGAGGSNKNNDPISPADCVAQGLPETCDSWHWDAGNNPAKDDLTNVYAYATFADDGDLIIYSGFERIAPEGDSHIDIEFFQDPVALDEDVPCNDPDADVTPCEFTGVRSDGDLIVSMDFVVGGGIGEVSIREWRAAQNTYVPVGASAGQGCNGADTICAFNNNVSIAGGPWPNFDRNGAVIDTLTPNSFTEFGVNVTELLGGTPCISTFMGKTRSSQSFTAELKDFSGPAGFNICGASIAIATDDVNEVGQDHTFTVTVLQQLGQTTAPAEGVIVDVTLADANGAINDISANTCGTPPGTDANGQCTVTFTSDSPGTVTGHASADVDVFGTSFHVETDGTGENSGDAVKRFVDANITIAPEIDANPIDDTHTFTVTVNQNAGDGNGFVVATEGNVDVVLTDSGGAVHVLDTAASTCDDNQPDGDNLDANGQCTVVFTSNTAGTVTGNATVNLVVGGVSLVRDTDPATSVIGAGPGGSGPAVKAFVDANITITPEIATNPIGGPHTFTVTVNQNAGDGNGFVVATEGNVDVVLTDSNGAAHVLDTAASTCDDNQPDGDNLDANGQCTVVFTSNTAGTVTGNATVHLTVGGVPLVRDTDPATSVIGAGPGGSGPAVKAFVDANITITPEIATNPIGGPHTFTVTVNQNAGDGNGFVVATEGNVDVVLTDSNGAAHVLDTAASTCDDNQPDGDNLDANGQCTVVFTSNTAGTVTGNATVHLTVGGVPLVRDTDPATALIGAGPGGSGPAVKVFVVGAIRINKNSTKGTGLDAVTNPGAVFSISGPFAPASVIDNGANDGDPLPGRICVTGLMPTATYTINETSPPQGYGGASQLNVDVVAVAGDCSSAGLNTATFTNPPLADIIVAYRDGGSGETSLTSIDCAGLGTSPDALDDPALTGWDESARHLGIPIDPSPRTITCEIVIDP